jgi:hypothetical protein
MGRIILTHQEVLDLHAAVVSAELAAKRAGLLAQIDSDFVASLTVAGAPSEQVLSDLSAMNTAGSLVNGTVPLEAWLCNVIALAGSRREVQLFTRTLELVRTRTLAVARGQAIQAAAEASATVTQLRAIGVSLARISLNVLARAGILGRFPWVDKLQLRSELATQLRDLGVPQSEIDSAEEALRFFIRYRLAWKVVDAAKSAHAAGHSPSLESPEDLASRCRGYFDFDTRRMPTAQEFREHFKGFVSSELDELLDDLEHLEGTGEVRRPHVLDQD